MFCQRCQQQKTPMSKKLPWDEALTQEIQQHICTTCWEEWEAQAIKVINELGLKLFLPEDQQKLKQQLREFLKLDFVS